MPKKHICERCGKPHNQKSHLDAHMKRKNPCKKDDTLTKLIEAKVEEKVNELVNIRTMELLGVGGERNEVVRDTAPPTDTAIVRYLGCKNKLLPSIGSVFDECLMKLRNTYDDSKRFTVCDGFAGTGVVSSFLSTKDVDVVACDLLYSSCILTECKVGITPSCLRFTVGDNKTIEDILKYLNGLDGVEGYITRTFTPVGGRMYFTEENGRKIDAIQSQIEMWVTDGAITPIQKTFLIGCLLIAVSRVSNTSGTYGAYNKTWDSRSLKPIMLESVFTLPDRKYGKVYNTDIKELLKTITCDILYLDPPYNKRQYGSYYHILETIARNDKPVVRGVTGLRDWKSDTHSKWCVPKHVRSELDDIVRNANTAFVVMSYNSEGLLTKDDIESVLCAYGTVHTKEIEFGRYNSKKGGEPRKVNEYIFILEKTGVLPSIPVPSLPSPMSVSSPLPPWYNTITHGDCIEHMKSLPDKSIHMILTDLPYGLTECKWDSVIPLEQMWEQYKRIITPNGAIVLFGQQPFTSRLISSNYEMFKYSLVWKKSKPGNFAQAPYRFLCEHEDILVFSYGKTAKNGVPRMTYNPQGTIACNKVMKGKTGSTAHRGGRSTQKDYKQTTTNYPRSILEFKNEGKPQHPTQKPIDLCEYLIRTYTNEGEIVLDSCMGSGTTAVAASKCSRNYVGYERELSYYEVCQRRLGKDEQN